MKIIIQMIGYAAMACSIWSFQQNEHKKIIRLQLMANSLFTVQYFLLGAFSGAVLNLLAVLRAIVFYNHGKKWADARWWPAVFCLAFAIFGAATYTLPVTIRPIVPFTWLSEHAALVEAVLPLLPAVAMIINTFSFAARNPAVTRLTILFSSPGWVIYSFISGSYGGFFNECFVILSALAAIFRYDILHRKARRDTDVSE